MEVYDTIEDSPISLSECVPNTSYDTYQTWKFILLDMNVTNTSESEMEPRTGEEYQFMLDLIPRNEGDSQMLYFSAHPDSTNSASDYNKFNLAPGDTLNFQIGILLSHPHGRNSLYTSKSVMTMRPVLAFLISHEMVVAQMYNCIRMEFRKCFHSHNFIISMATCVLLALSSASYCCQGYLNIHDALDQYCFENGHMVSNELFPVWTSYNYWIGGESETLAYSAFYTLLPLFAILPHSLSCLQEKNHPMPTR